ncbi:hypothetical protein GF389_03890 [Candidatus Dojkabacteria bacterium]|nr:hypothetical protein [Candidatus Dojkabacteria bacterium]
MHIPRPKDALHKNQLYRLLREILQHRLLANHLMFKGGTYATFRGVLDRFSVDLDFDLPDASNKEVIRKECYKIFDSLGLEIKDESHDYLQFFLKYESKPDERNTLKLEINDKPSKHNEYEKVLLTGVDMYCNGHNLETMFANKLVAAKERFDRNRKIAGRDFYDIHKFFQEGLTVKKEIVEERTKLDYVEYLEELINLIEKKVSEELLQRDLNPLLDNEKLKQIKDKLKPELILFLRDEVARG